MHGSYQVIGTIKAQFLNTEACRLILVYLLLIFLHLFIFRDIFSNLSLLVNGEATIVRDELIPFYDFNSQFWSQVFSTTTPITLTDEIRVGYSFLDIMDEIPYVFYLLH